MISKWSLVAARAPARPFHLLHAMPWLLSCAPERTPDALAPAIGVMHQPRRRFPAGIVAPEHWARPAGHAGSQFLPRNHRQRWHLAFPIPARSAAPPQWEPGTILSPPRPPSMEVLAFSSLSVVYEGAAAHEAGRVRSFISLRGSIHELYIICWCNVLSVLSSSSLSSREIPKPWC